jgi:hypothetical protein
MVDFNILQTPDYVGGAINALHAGQQDRQASNRRNALAMFPTDPGGAQNALAANGDFQDASAVNVLIDRKKTTDAETAAAPFVADGNYGSAARTVAATNPQLAQTYMGLDKAALDHIHALGEHAASVLFSAATLPPEQRKAYAAEHRDEIVAGGVAADKFDSFDWTDTPKVLATGYQFLDAKNLAGQVKMQKFGDSTVTYRTGPTGVDVLNTQPIPETRTEMMERLRLQEEQRSHRANESVASTRERREAAQTGRINSTGDVMGPIMAKIAQGAPLTPGEQQLYNDRKNQGIFGNMGGYGDEGTPPPPPAHGGAPQPTPLSKSAPTAPPAAPTPAAAAGPPVTALKEGVARTFANGQEWTLRGGHPVRLK